MATAKGMDLALGIVMIVLGILVLSGNLGVGWIIFAAAVVLIVVGVLMLVKQMPGGMVMGIVAIVIGAILFFPDKLLGQTLNLVLHIVIGVLLLVFGILKVMGK